MHLPLVLIILFIVLAIVIVALADWLALHIFGLKTTKINLAKIIGIEVVVTAAASLSWVLLIADIVIWAALIKHYMPAKYSLSKAIGSFATSYILVVVFSVAVAALTLSSIMQTFAINGNSMAPALHDKNTVLVYKFEKHPSDNQIIIYHTNTGIEALGRVRSVPGQRLCRATGQVNESPQKGSTLPCSLSSNQYLVTVDNSSYNIPPRVISSDSIVGTVGPTLD